MTLMFRFLFNANSYRSTFLGYSFSFFFKLKAEKYSFISKVLWSRFISIRYGYSNLFKLHRFRTRRLGG